MNGFTRLAAALSLLASIWAVYLNYVHWTLPIIMGIAVFFIFLITGASDRINKEEKTNERSYEQWNEE